MPGKGSKKSKGKKGDPYMDFYEGYTDYGGNGECDISLRSDLGFDYGEDLSMEVEEILYGDPPNISDVESADFESDEPPALKIPPKAPPRRNGQSNWCASCNGCAEVTAPKLVKGDPPQAGGTTAHLTTMGQAGVPAGLSRLSTNPLSNFVLIHVAVICPDHVVYASACQSLGPLASPFDIGLWAAARYAGVPGVTALGMGSVTVVSRSIFLRGMLALFRRKKVEVNKQRLH
ncbi:hypothetical protein P4O66_010283 [Electrophorus voltai]|uniref:Uncharacterized protein n=1 Tax=Electrophorus voltai TaxID=2609070 RepID=A0AAD8Z9L5_9TELE|nr:hypothetical protein P4O66_010283 [Electrophorus voltai]